jgi:hypothetical protein
VKTHLKGLWLSKTLWRMYKNIPPNKRLAPPPDPGRKGPKVTHGLTDDQVLMIRSLEAYHGYCARTIADAFGFLRGPVCKIVSGITQSHLVAKRESATAEDIARVEAYLNDN